MSKIYRNYDVDELDAQYNLRRLWSDVPDAIARRENESRKLRQEINGQLDIPYGQSEMEKLDFFSPINEKKKRPGLIYIHGGYWQLSDKSDTTYIAPGFLDFGVCFITINYSLAPNGNIVDMVNQCRRAVLWVWKNSQDYGLDANRLYIAGHSAGGHLTAMMLTTNWKLIDPEMPSQPFKGACALSGIYDLEPIRLSPFVNEALGLKKEDVQYNSPIFLNPKLDIPLLLGVGELETEEFKRHQAELYSAWTAMGADITSLTVPDCHHYTIVEKFGNPESEFNRIVREIIL